MSEVATGNRLRALKVLGGAVNDWNPSGEVNTSNRYSNRNFPTAMGLALERAGWATFRLGRAGYYFTITEEGRRVLEASRAAEGARDR